MEENNKIVTGNFFVSIKLDVLRWKIKSTLKNKFEVDFYNYKILGAFNPAFAYKALQAEDKIGTMLPCNVIVQEKNQE